MPIVNLQNIQGQPIKTTDRSNIYLIYQADSAHSREAIKSFGKIAGNLQSQANFIYTFPMGEEADQIDAFFKEAGFKTPNSAAMLDNNSDVGGGLSLQDLALKNMRLTQVPAIVITDRTNAVQFTNLGATDENQIKNIINIGLGNYTKN